MRYQVRMHPTMDILVSSVGEVFIPASGTHKAHWTFGSDNGRGYKRVMVNGKHYRVQRLVAETFIGPIPDGYEVDHINRNREDNALNNIRITTRSQNQRNTVKNDRVDARGGTHSYEDKKQFYEEQWVTYRKTHKCVRFSNGKSRWLPNSEASEIRKLPVKERIFKGD